MLIRLRGCTGWCAPLLFKTPKTGFLALRHHMHIVARNPTLLHSNNKESAQCFQRPRRCNSYKENKIGHNCEHGESFYNISRRIGGPVLCTNCLMMLSAGRQIDTSRKSIYTCRITIDSMIFKDQTNQNTPCLRFGLHMVRTWHIKHRLQQMQGFHEKHFQYKLTFHLFKFFLISKVPFS